MRARIASLCLIAVATFTTPAPGQSNGSVIAVLGVPEEIAPIERKLANPETQRIGATVITTGTLDGRKLVVARSGIGKVNAAAATTILIDRFHPAALFFSGTAGAVDTALNPGDVVIGVKVAQHDIGRITADGFLRRPTRDSVTGQPDPMFFDAPAELLAAARQATADVKVRVREGTIVTGDMFVADAGRREDLRAFGATAVEMEGAAMVQVCRQFATPCLVVRGITDSANASAQVNYQQWLKPASENAAALVVALIEKLDRRRP